MCFHIICCCHSMTPGRNYIMQHLHARLAVCPYARIVPLYPLRTSETIGLPT